MYNFPIGVILDSFRTDIPTALAKAAKVPPITGNILVFLPLE